MSKEIESCLCMDVRAAARRLTERYDEALAPSGITITQFSQLHLIRSLGKPTLKELSAASDLERSTLGRNIRVMEKDGLVDLKPGDDARTRTIQISSKGNAAFKKAVPLWLEVQEERRNLIGAEERKQLVNQLQQVSRGIA